MKFARHWVRLSTSVRTPNGSQQVSALGWSDVDEPTARRRAEERLRELAELFRHGIPRRGEYGYGGERPLAEPIVDTLTDASGRELGVITRNAYGALVLNTDRAVFIDVDFPTEAPKEGFLAGLFGRSRTLEEHTLERVESAAHALGRTVFRVYRTHAGLRLLALDLDAHGFDEDKLRLLQHFGSDPLYVKLCAAQRCFRARLTPKPWRMGCPKPPSRFPFTEPSQLTRFQSWLTHYEQRARAHATCKLLTTIGLGHPTETVARVLAVHDRFTLREGAPLA